MPLIGSLGAAASRGFGQFLQKITAVLNTDAFFKYVTLLLTGNPPTSTFVTDASTNNLQVTINGDTKPSGFSPNENGYYSFYAATNNDYFIYNDQGAGNFNTGDFTVEFFGFNVNQTTNWIMAGSTANNWQIVNYQNGFYWQENGGNLGGMGFTVPNNQWVHYAISRTGGLLNVYINGTRQYSATNTYNYSAVGNRIIGQASGGVSDKVWMSNLRIIRGTGIYSGTSITVPTSPLTVVANTQLLTCQSNRMIDSAGIQQFTSAGSPQIVGFQPFTPNPSFATYGSTYFDGNGDYLTVPANNVFAFGTGDYTIEFWVYSVIAYSGVICLYNNNSGGYFLQYNTGVGLQTGVAGVSATGTYSTTLIANSWNHIAVSRASGSSKCFVNGTQVGTTLTDNTNYAQNGAFIGALFNGAQPLNGYLSNFRIVKGTALYTAAFTPPATQLTAVTNTSLLTCQTNQPVNNNVFLDSSSNNFAITRAGNTTQGSLNPYGGNWSNYFDGTGDYLNCSANSAQFGTGDFTIECWIYPTSLAAIQVIVDFRTTSTAIFGQIYLATNGTVHFYLPPDIATTNTVTLNAWNHIAISRSAGTLKMFINGTSGYSAANSGTYNAVGTYIGISISNTNGFTGYISNMRFITGTGIYTSNFTPSTTPLTAIAKTSLLTCQSNRFIDNSNNNFTITKTNDVKAQRFSPFSPVLSTPTSYSNYFDGSGDYLSVADNAALNLSTGDFTLECWIYITSFSSNSAILDKRLTSGSTAPWVWYTDTSGKLNFYNGTNYITTTSFPLNTWTHVVTSRASGTLYQFINGVSGMTATSVTANLDTTGTLLIGTSNDTTPAYLKGYISNLRIVKGTAVYTANFTPPTTPLTAVSGTSLLTCQSPTIIDNSANNFPITITGDVAARTQNPFGVTNTDAPYTPATYGGSMYFDGTTDYLTLATNPQLGMGSGDFTVEFWTYQTSLVSYRQILDVVDANSVGRLILWVDSAGTIYNLGQNGNARNTSAAGAIVANAWVHVVLTRLSGTTKFYINGVQSGTNYTDSTNYTCTSGSVYIGINSDGGTYPYIGYLANFRMVKGTSLYKANFAPPVAPLQAVTNTSLLLLGSNGAVYDSAMLNNQETVGDAKVTTAVSKFGGSSMYFDGSDNLSIPLNTSYKIGTGEFTIEAWVYHTNSGSYAGYYYGGNAGLVLRRTDANKLEISQDGIASIAISTNTIPSNQWVHVAGTRSGTTVRIFINGVLEGTATYSGNFAPTTAATVGSISNVAGYYMTGYIDDLRITNGYARYTQTFAVPTQPFPVQ